MSEPPLLEQAHALLEIPSLSRHEKVLTDRIEAELREVPWLAVIRIGDNVVARTEGDGRRRVLLAGHLDTVSPSGNDQPRLVDGELWGIGAVDMKGTLAVMLDLATHLERPSVELTWCFYAREEVNRVESGLAEVAAADPDLLAADVAILGEPTSCLVEAGCQGTLRAELVLRGTRAHPARPFTGRNAIHRLAPVLTRVAGWEGREVDLDGCRYVEQLQVVSVNGGVAANVVPDEVHMTVNHRYAPDRDVAASEAFLRELLDGLVEPDDELVVVDAVDGAPPSLEEPFLTALVEASGQAPRAKVGWTDVAFFASLGIPAVNFGAGDPLLAHHPDEHVSSDALERAREILASLLTGGEREGP